jgi:hypothetical protein
VRAIPFNVTIMADDGDGFIVQVGCKTFAYTDPRKLADNLTGYLLDPDGAVKQYFRAHPRSEATSGIEHIAPGMNQQPVEQMARFNAEYPAGAPPPRVYPSTDEVPQRP